MIIVIALPVVTARTGLSSSIWASLCKANFTYFEKPLDYNIAFPVRTQLVALGVPDKLRVLFIGRVLLSGIYLGVHGTIAGDCRAW